MDNSSAKDVNHNFAFESLTAIRNRLLDLTSRNLSMAIKIDPLRVRPKTWTTLEVV